MHAWLSFVQTFITLLVELTVLFILVSFIVSWLQQKVSEERVHRLLTRNRTWKGYLYGTGLGALTPFCSCSTIPIVAGLLSSKAPFGPSMSFLIASPLLNPVIVLLLWTLLGWEITLIYMLVVGLFAIAIGVMWTGAGLEQSVKTIRVRKAGHTEDMSTVPRWKVALQDAWSFFYPILPFLLIGVFIGAWIYNFVPQELIANHAGEDTLWSIPVASVIGIPMYIRAEAILPIGDAFISKGMSTGAVIAMLIGGAGASIPEVILLNKLFRKKLVIAFVLSILFVAVSTGAVIQIIT